MVTNLGIRRLAAQDIPEMRKLFRATVLTVNSKDYTKEEVEDWASCGDVATLLLSEVEKMARRYEVHKINVEVSITARPFFEKRGYKVVKEQKRGYKVVKEQKARANRLWLTNYVMEKAI